MMMKRILSLLMIVALMCSSAPAEASSASVSEGGLELMGSSVRYPQVTGLEDETLQQQVNQSIQQSLGVPALLSRLAMVMNAPVPLTASYEAQITGNVFTAVLSASGPVLNDRTTHVWYAANVDLEDGSLITLADLFADPEAALAAISDELDFTIAPDLSAHLRNSALTPVPEVFSISDTGLTLYYPIDQLSTLSDRAGAVTFLWTELRDYLVLEEGSVLDRIGAKAMLEGNADAIRTAAEAGRLPGIPVALGSSMQEAVDTYRMLTDPDLYQDGRMFALEAAAFRQAWVLTDALTEGWDHSVVKGLRTDRICLYGLYTGMSRSDAQLILGAPAASVHLDQEAAEGYRLNPGVSDYYNYTGAQLRLHFDGEEKLQSLMITQSN